MPDSKLDLSDIPESTDAELRRFVPGGWDRLQPLLFSCWLCGLSARGGKGPSGGA